MLRVIPLDSKWLPVQQKPMERTQVMRIRFSNNFSSSLDNPFIRTKYSKIKPLMYNPRWGIIPWDDVKEF